MHTRRPYLPSFLLLALCAAAALAGDDDIADFTLKLAQGQSVKYVWATAASTEATGRERGEAVKIKSETNIDVTFQIKGLPRKGPGLPLSLRLEHYSSTEKKSVGTDVLETQATKGKIKVIERGKVIVDSENDIGLEEVKSYQEMYKKIIAGEMRTTIDPAGKEVGESEGEPGTIDVLKASGAEGLLRLVTGRELKPGQSWEDSQSMPVIANFKLAKPAHIRSKSTFAGWETKDGKRLARIDIKSAWDPGDLKGENEEGLLVEITKVQGVSAGTCLFDPAAGQFVDGLIDVSSKYRIDGKKEGQSTGLDVVSTMKFVFKQNP